MEIVDGFTIVFIFITLLLLGFTKYQSYELHELESLNVILNGQIDLLQKEVIGISSHYSICNDTQLKIELAVREEEIKNLNDQFQMQKILYEEFQIPLEIGNYCGTDAMNQYIINLENEYN